MSTHTYTEDQLVEQPAIGLFWELRLIEFDRVDNCNLFIFNNFLFE